MTKMIFIVICVIVVCAAVLMAFRMNRAMNFVTIVVIRVRHRTSSIRR
jgi:hypothetical protein